ncbi:MAG: MFS transporter, partial [Cypionkella sp.]
MRSARLELALESGLLRLPLAGDIVVMRPRAGDDLSALPQERVVVQTGFKPDHDYFAAQGYRSSGEAGLAIVCVPRSKPQARAMMAAARGAAAIVVDGQKTDGVESLLKDCKGLGLQISEVLSKAHGKLAVVTPSERLAEWAAVPAEVDGFQTVPGV